MYGPGGIDDRPTRPLPTDPSQQVGTTAPVADPHALDPNAAPHEPTPARDPADDATVHDARTRALGAEEEARTRLEHQPGEASGPRTTRGLTRAATPPADLEARVDALEQQGRRGAFAQSPEAAADYARRFGEVAPHLDDDTRRHLQRPLDDWAAHAARTQDPQAVAVARELAPALGSRGVEAFSRTLLENPDARTREQSVGVLDRAARDNRDPLVRQQAAHGILNDAPTVEQALRGEHPSISRDRIADLAARDPARTNQLLDRARDIDPAIEQDLLGRGLSRTQLPEVGGVVGGIIDGVEGLTAPFVRPVETAQGVARLAGAAVRDPVGTGRAIVESAVEAVREDAARAITGAVVGMAGGAALGHARRLSTAGRAAHVDAPDTPRTPTPAARPNEYEVGNVRVRDPAELGPRLEADGWRPVHGGDMQRVYERNGEYLKLRDPGRPENRQFNPAAYAARDAEAAEDVTRTLEVMERMRAAYPGVIPETRRVGPTAFVQQRAQGMDISDLSGDAQAAARRNADAMLRDARERFGMTFDPNIYNFRFDPTGRVTSWFDPL